MRALTFPILICLFLITACGVELDSSLSDVEEDLPATPTKKLELENFPNRTNTIFGGWQADLAVFEPGGIAKFVHFYFNRKGQMGLAVTCVAEGDNITISGAVDVRITASTIKLPQALRMNSNGTGSNIKCRIALRPGALAYRVERDRLKLTLVGRETENFSRIP